MLAATLTRAGFRDVEVRKVDSPVKLPSAADCVRFERESFGALHQMLSGLGAAEVADTWREIEADPSHLPFEMSDEERSTTCGKRWEEAIRPLAEEVERGGDGAWDAIVARDDGYSTRESLEQQHLREASI